MKCLRCDSEMKVTKNNDVEVDVCVDGCGGIWFDGFELKKMNESSEISRDFHDVLFRAKNKSVDLEPRLQCPKCQVKMLRHFASLKKRVEIDQCPQCYGHWLDGGELTKIARLYESTEERMRETQKVFQNILKK